MLAKEISALIKKELLLEMRQRYALGSIVVYVVSTIFVCYLSFRQVIDVPTWNALFWIILLFASINAVSKSFLQEGPGRLLYYYTIASPQGIILSKIIYNSLLMGLVSILCLLTYALLIGNPINDLGMFCMCLLLGSFGFSATLTLMSAISSKTSGNLALMAILSFPVLLPLLIVLIRLSKNAIDGLAWSANWKYLLALAALDLIVLMLSYLLFPYLWRD